MPVFSLRLLNHLGEPFERHNHDCADAEEALRTAQALSEKGYPVEVTLDGEVLARVRAPPWRPDPWLRDLIGEQAASG